METTLSDVTDWSFRDFGGLCISCDLKTGLNSSALWGSAFLNSTIRCYENTEHSVQRLVSQQKKTCLK